MIPITDIGLAVLAATFAAAGVSKVRSPYPAAVAIVRFGLAKGVHPRLARLLGWIEVAVAAAALTTSHWLAVVPAAALLGTFTLLLARVVVRGERFECSCFGTSSTIGVGTLARTAALFTLALATAFRLDGGAPADAPGRMLALAAVVNAAVVASIVRQHARNALGSGLAAREASA